MKQGKISVIVPVYKVEKYLDQCIRSIVCQTYPDLEIILIDDGSPDNCGKICDVWERRDSRIRVIHQKNHGVSAARNTALDIAAGDFIFFVDSDDYLEPDTLFLLADALIQHEANIAVCNFTYEFEYEEDRKLASPKMLDGCQIKQSDIFSGVEFMMLADQGKYAFVIVNWNKLYRREVFNNIRYPVGKRFEDEMVIHHLLYPCQKIVTVPYIGYHYLQHSDSFMHENDRLADYIEALLDRCSYFLEKDEQELTLSNEGRLLSAVKKAEKQLPKRELQLIKQSYFRTVWKIWLKMWIPAPTLIKRFVRCKLV